jgi:hypothetical protein
MIETKIRSNQIGSKNAPEIFLCRENNKTIEALRKTFA